MRRSDNDIAIITGGGSGIGQAVAWAFSARGIHTVIFGRTEQRLAVTARQAHGPVSVVCGDVSIKKDRYRLKKHALDIGKIKWLVHAAGVFYIEPIESISIKKWHKIMGINVDGRLWLTTELLDTMSSGARVLFIGSRSSTRARVGASSYCVSMAASSMLQHCLHAELSARKIFVLNGMPGSVDTCITQKALSADKQIFPDRDRYRDELFRGQLHSPINVGQFFVRLLLDIPDTILNTHGDTPWNIEDKDSLDVWINKVKLENK